MKIFHIFKALKNNVSTQQAKHILIKINEVRNGIISSIPDAYWQLLSSDSTLKKEIISLLNNVMLNLKTDNLLHLDRIFRERTSFDWTYDWRKESPYNLYLASSTEEEKISILGLSTFHPNGYFREKAVHELSKYSGKRVIQFLLIRVNDWVNVIQNVTATELYRRFSITNAKQIIENITLINRLKYLNRINHGNLISMAYSILSKEDAINELKKSLYSTDPKIRLFCAQILINSTKISTAEILNLYLRERLPSIKLFVLRNLTKEYSDDIFEKLAISFDKEKNASIKLAILTYFLLYKGSSVIPYLETSVFDSNRIVRIFSRTELSKKMNIDFRSQYLTKLSEKSKIIGSIEGIGETGTSEDVKILRQYLEAENSRIVRSTLKSIVYLDREAIRNDLFLFLDDKRQGVSKEAKNLLISDFNYADSDKIIDIYQQNSLDYIKMNCIKLLVSLPKWDRIYFILKYYNDDNEKIRDFMKIEFARWQSNYNRSYATPSKEQVNRIKDILETHNLNLSEKDKELLLFSIKQVT